MSQQFKEQSRERLNTSGWLWPVASLVSITAILAAMGFIIGLVAWQTFLSNPGFFGELAPFEIAATIVAALGAAFTVYLLYVRSMAADKTARLGVEAQTLATQAQQQQIWADAHRIYTDGLGMLGAKSEAAQIAGVQILIACAFENPNRYARDVAAVLVKFTQERCREQWKPLSDAMEALARNEPVAESQIKILVDPWVSPDAVSMECASITSRFLADATIRGVINEDHIRFGEVLFCKGTMGYTEFRSTLLDRWLLDRVTFGNCSFEACTLLAFVRGGSRVVFRECQIADTKLSLLPVAHVEKMPNKFFIEFESVSIHGNVSINGRIIETGILERLSIEIGGKADESTIAQA